MKKTFLKLKWGITCLIVCCFFKGVEIEANAAELSKDNIRTENLMDFTLYETSKDNVPVWKSATKNSGKIENLKDKGTLVRVKQIVTNSYGNKWAKLYDKGFIYLGNIKEHKHGENHDGYMYVFDKSNLKNAAKGHYIFCICGEKITGKEIEKHVYENDNCLLCNYYRKIEFGRTLPFITIKDNVPVRKEASSKVETLYTLEDAALVNVVARYRSENGNLWAVDEEGNFIYFENLALAFDMLLQEEIEETKRVRNPQAVFWDNVVESGDLWDYKTYLGAGIIYNVFLDETFIKMSGETIGNFNYGYVGSAVGLSRNNLLWGGGLEQIKDNGIITNIKNCVLYYCDNKNDHEDVERGIEYYYQK